MKKYKKAFEDICPGQWWDDLMELMGVFGWGAFITLIAMDIAFHIIEFYLTR